MAVPSPGRGSVGLPTDWKPAIQSLTRSLDEARHFRGSLVIVHGPPGVGKTRFIDGALADANVLSRRVRRTFLESRDTESPYKAVLSLVRWAAKLEEVEPSRDAGSLVLAPFIRALGSGPGDSGGGLVTVAPEDRTGSTGSEYRQLVADLEFYKRGVEAWGERSRFLHEVGWMILDAAARRHIIWVVEGAQYLDPHSLTVIRYLAACSEENPLVIWLNADTTEDGQIPPTLAALLNSPRAVKVEVPRLSRVGVREVLGWKYPGHEFSDRVVDSVLKETHGLLLNVDQLASDPRVRRSGAPQAHEGSDALDVVLRRLEQIPSPARDLVEKLAVVGEGTSFQTAVALARRDEPDVRRDLASLVAAGLLLEQEADQYCFRLTALPGEIEARLPVDRFRALHREAAEALQSSASGFEERIFDLAEHWRKAEVWDAAALASLTAARFSSDSFAPEGGLLHAQRALDAARQSTDRRPTLEAEALIEKGRALYDLGRLHESLDALRQAVALIGVAPADWSFRARALFYLARALSSLARPQEALELVQEASRALAQVDDARARLMLHQVIGVAFMMSDQNREAVEHFRSMLSLAQELGDAREVSYAQKNLSAVLLALDPHDKEGWQLVNSALEHHTRTSNFAGLAAGYLNRSMTKLSLKDSDGALSDLDHSRQAAELAHAPLLIATATIQEVTVLLGRSEVERAGRLLKALAPWMATMEEPWAHVSFSLLLGRVAEAQRRMDDAERSYEDATTLAEPAGESPMLWECHMRQAALARKMGVLDRFQRLRDALPSAQEIGKVAPDLAALRQQLEAPAS
jgi:tetratricopeptide (TPR) repeat protein